VLRAERELTRARLAEAVEVNPFQPLSTQVYAGEK
jgi:hypothetical protein